jgi:hypothetical protein
MDYSDTLLNTPQREFWNLFVARMAHSIIHRCI